MKKFFEEFRKFITRGNVVDLAVGVIVGSAFTAIVNALSNSILKPLINWLLAVLLKGESLSDVCTFLKTATLADGTIDLENSIYIDWGAFINAIINFFLIALVLFVIVRLTNRFNDKLNEIQKDLSVFSKKEIRALRKQGYSIKEIKKIQEEKIAEEKRILEEKKKAEEEEKAKNAPPTTEQLLAEILKEIKAKQ